MRKAAIVCGALMACNSSAVNGQTTWTWSVNANGNWSTATNWNPNVAGGPQGIDAIANLTNAISSNRTVTLDVNTTLGILNIGDQSGGQSFTLNSTGGATLTFEVSDPAEFAQINKINDGGNDTISAGMELNSALAISMDDPTNGTVLVLNGPITTGTGANAPQSGSVAMTFTPTITSVKNQILQLGNAQNNTFLGQLVINSGTLRSEGDGTATLFGALGIGNETVIKDGGRLDLRNHDFNLNTADGKTEIFMIEGSGWRGMGSLVNSSTTGTVSHVILTGDTTIGGTSTIEFRGYTNTSTSEFLRAKLEANGHALTKMGVNTVILYDTDILGLNQVNIREGELRLSGTTRFDDGTVINLGYNQGAFNPDASFDPTDFSQGSRSQTDVNSSAGGTAYLAEARLEFTAQKDMVHDLVINLNRGWIETSGSTTSGSGNTFKMTLDGTINLLGGGVQDNFFNVTGGSDGTIGSGASTVYEHPGWLELDATLDNTSAGNLGSGLTKVGNRELRIGKDQTAFNGEFAIVQQTGRFLNRGFSTASGAPESQYFNVALTAEGTLRNASRISLERGASITLLNSGFNVDNRINDNGTLALRNGYMHLITDATATNAENWGNVVTEMGTNWFMIDGRAGGKVDSKFKSLTVNEGSVLQIINLDGDGSFGTENDDGVRVSVEDTSALEVVGNTNAAATTDRAIVYGVLGGTVPGTPATVGGGLFRPEEQLENALGWSGSGVGFMTLETVNGVTYLRALKDSEYSSTLATGVNWNVTDSTGNAGVLANVPNVAVSTTINSLRIADATLRTTGQDSIYIAPGATLTINSGMITFSSFGEGPSANLEPVIRGGGGFIDMNGQVGIINNAASWHDTDSTSNSWSSYIASNSAYIRTHITNATGMVKTGRGNLYFETWNDYSGTTYVSEAILVLRHDRSLGSSNRVELSGEGSLYLQGGVNTSGSDLLVQSTTNTRWILYSNDSKNNVWGGNIIIDGVDVAGTQLNNTYYMSGTNDATLSIMGDIYATDPVWYSVDSDYFNAGRLIATDDSTSTGRTTVVNLYGQFKDTKDGALGLPVYNRGDIEGVQYDRNHLMRFQIRGHNEKNVNVFQQWDSAGQIDVTAGFLRVMYDPASAGGFYSDAAVAAWYTNGTHTIANLINEYYTRTSLGGPAATGTSVTSGTATYNGAIMLTTAGQIFNNPNIYIYNANRDGAITLGSENTSGTVYFGSNDSTGTQQSRIVFENHGGDRDLRFYQRAGGTSEYNLRLLDNGTSVNSSVTKIGQGTSRLVDNSYGASSVERWNIMGGTMEWQQTQQSTNRFAASTAQLTMGGGMLNYIGNSNMTATRSQTLSGQLRFLTGGSEIRVTGAAATNSSFATNLILGTLGTDIIRQEGSTVLFSKIANGGTVNLVLNGTPTESILPWAVYSEQNGVVNDFALVSSGGSVPNNVVSADVSGQYNTSTQNVADWSGKTAAETGWATDTNLFGYTGTMTSSGAVQGLRFYGATDGTITLADDAALTLMRGAILVATNVGGNEKSILGGELTSEEYWEVSPGVFRSELMIHNYNAAGNFTIGSVITNNSMGDTVSLVHSGTGTTVLTGVNTYTGNTYLVGGTLQISQDANLGSSTAASTLYLNGGTLRTTESFELNANRGIVLGGDGGAIETTAGTTLTYSGLISGEGNVVDPTNGYTANILDNPLFGDFTKKGGGTLVLDGTADNSAFSGLMLIEEGILSLQAPTAPSLFLGTNHSAMDGTIIQDGATLDLAMGANWTTNEWFTFNGSGYLGAGALRTSGTARTYTFNGQLTIETDSIFNISNGSLVQLNGGGDLLGSGDIIRIGNSGELRFFGNAPNWTGNLILGSGTNWLYNETGKITGVQGIALSRNAFFGMINESTGSDPYGDRINDAAPITMTGYSRLRMQGQSAVYSGYEALGDLTIANGMARVQVYTARVTGANGGTPSPTFSGLIFNSISRQQGAVLKFTVNENGGKFADSSFGTSVFSDVGVIAVKELPTELLHGGNGSNGTNRSILKGVFGGAYHDLLTSTNGNVDGESTASRYLMTVDAAIDPFTGQSLNVIRPLADSEYVNVTNSNDAQVTRVQLETQDIHADDNVALRGRASSLDNPLSGDLKTDFVTLEGDLTVNSLSIYLAPVTNYTGGSNGGAGERMQVYLGEGSTLTISSGVLNVANLGVVERGGTAQTSNLINQTVYILGGELDFNGQEAIINAGSVWHHHNYTGQTGYGSAQSSNSDLYIASSITNANGLTKVGERSLILGGINSYTGPTNVVEGLLYVRHAQALGQSEIVNVMGNGGFVVQEGVTINGVDIRIGEGNPGNRNALVIESGSGWGGDIIIDNVDITGQAGLVGTTINRNIVRSTSSIGIVSGNIYGDPSYQILGANGTASQMVSTLGTSDGTLWLKGSFKDTAAGAFSEKVTELNQNQVLRFEIAGSTTSTYSTSTFRSNNELAVWVDNQWDAVGRINHEQGYLYYHGDGNFWTNAAAQNMNPSNLMSGYHMGGDVSSTTVTNQNLALFLTKDGQVFNISSFGVGLENDLGNRTGNSTVGGVQSSGIVTFGLGTGSIIFEAAASGTYNRDLRLFQREGGITNVAFNLVDGGSGVKSSITKVGGGVVNLLGSSAGGSTVEAVNMVAGRLVLGNYAANLNRRVGQNAQIRLGGGTLVMVGDAAFTEQLGAANVAAGGSTVMATDAGTIQLTSTISHSAMGTVHFQEVNGGAIITSGIAAGSRLGSYATFGSSANQALRADGWAATDGVGNLVAYTHSAGEINTFGSGLHTDVQTVGAIAGTTGSVRFNTANATVGSGALTLEDGGVLFSSNYTGGAAIAAGVDITTSSSLVDLIFHNYASGEVTVAGNILGAQNVVFSGPGLTTLAGANTYTGKTAIVGGAKVSIGQLSLLGVAPGTVVSDSLYLNDGTIRYTGTSTEVLDGKRGITLGGNGGTFEFTSNGKISYNGLISSEANAISDYVPASGDASMTNNPLSGDLTIKGAGTFQLGTDYAATSFSTADYGGLRNTYSGLTTIGDGAVKTIVALRGQPQDDQYIWPFGTHEGFDDGVRILNNSEMRFQFQRSSNGNFDGQVRLLEWFTFGESDADTTYMYNDTGRSVEIAGNTRINGTLVIHTQNTGVDAGNTGTSGTIQFGVNSGYGGQLLGDANSTLIKTGVGTLELRETSTGFEGTIEVRRGALLLYGYGDVAGVGDAIHLGDRTYTAANLGDRVLALVQRSSNNNTDLTSETEDLHLHQNIEVHGTLSTTTANNFLRSYLYTDDSSATYHGDIHINSRSSTLDAGLYVQLYGGNPVNPDITGRTQHNYVFLNGNISGSGTGETAFIDVRLNDQLSSGQFAPMYGYFILGGDNSGWKGELRIAGDNNNAATPDVYERTIVRLANDKALSAVNNVNMFLNSTLQAGGKSVTIGSLIQNGGVGSWDENATGTANSTMTIENAAKEDGYLTITENGNDNTWNVMFRDGETPDYFGDDAEPDGALHLIKDGAATAILNQLNTYTGTTTVAGGNLQVGQFGDGTRATADTMGRTGTGATIVQSGGTLSGTGVVQGGAVTTHLVNAGGILAPGDQGGQAVGTLFVDGNLTVQPGGSLRLQVASAHTYFDLGVSDALTNMDDPGYSAALASLIGNSILEDAMPPDFYDHLEIKGQLNINAGSTIEVVDLDYVLNYAAAGDVFNLLDWLSINAAGFNAGGTRWGGEAGFDLLLPELSEGLVWDTSLFLSDGILVVTAGVVPEPGRCMLLLVACGGIVLRRRRPGGRAHRAGC